MNSEVMQELRNAAKIQPGSRETFPATLSGSIVPILDITPKKVKNGIVKHITAANQTTSTIFTTPTVGDFYICSAFVSIIKDVTSTSTITSITCFPEGEATARSILSIPGITLTPQSATVSIIFPHPIKVSRNTAIVLNNDTNTANIKVTGGVTGFVDEVNG